MWAINWCFCHNGQVPLFEDHPNYQLGVRRSDDGNNSTINHQQQEQQRYYNPIGTTDSEATFCAILNALRNEFLTTMPSLPVLYEKIQSLCTEIVEYNPTGTILNFLLTCGPYVMWVYSWPGKRPGSTVWNGLYYSVRDQSANISDEDIDVMVSVKNNDDNGTKQQNMASNGNQQTINGKYSSENRNNICIVATKPLTTDDDWIELKPGELILLDEGIPNVTPTELFRVELQGHGMSNDGKVLNPPKLQEDMRRYAINPEYFVGSGI